jgi:hypothetical protein
LRRAVRPYEPPIILSAADTIPYRLLLADTDMCFPYGGVSSGVHRVSLTA